MNIFTDYISLGLLLIIMLCSPISACGTELTADSNGVIYLEENIASEIPVYSGKPYISINGGKAYFDAEDITTDAFELYSEQDAIGRCETAYANICEELMPTEKRSDISSIKPSGWNNAKYDNIAQGWLYNRCHLIGFQLAGENDNEKNLITGTRYLNIEGMLPFENMVAEYVKKTKNHVLYRVTPVYYCDNAVASGVRMEGYSVEDMGEGINFNVYCYNVQPDIYINYYTGESRYKPQGEYALPVMRLPRTDYIGLNPEHSFHKPNCSVPYSYEETDRWRYSGNRQDLINVGYAPCELCSP